MAMERFKEGPHGRRLGTGLEDWVESGRQEGGQLAGGRASLLTHSGLGTE